MIITKAKYISTGILFFLIAPITVLAPRGMPIVLILTSLVALLRMIGEGGVAALKPQRHPMSLIVAIFLIFVVVSVGWSPSARAPLTATEIVYVTLCAGVLFRFTRFIDLSERAQLERFFLIGLGVAGVLLVLDVAFAFPVNRWLDGIDDPQTVFGTNIPKRTGAAMALLVWAAVVILVRRNLISLAFGLVVISGAVLFGTDSRSSVFGLGVGVAACLSAMIASALTRRVFAAFLVALFVLAVPLAHVMSDVLHLDHAEFLFGSAQHRVEIWGRAANRIPEHLVLGHGIDASRAIVPRPGEGSRFAPLNGSLFPLHPHNIFLQLWLEIGLVGGGLFMAIALFLLRAVGKLPSSFQPSVVGLFVTGLFMANTAYGIWQVWWMASFVLTGVLTALAVRDNDAGQATAVE